MAKTIFRGIGNFSEIVDILEREVQKSGMSCKLVDKSIRGTENSPIVLLVFEKYFMRSGNRASLSVLVSKENGEIVVDTIGSGAGQGAFFSFSYGTESSFIQTVENILTPIGFQVDVQD